MTDFNALLDGYRRFRDERWTNERARWAQLAGGQSPKVMVIACSDSRVDPATIFDTSPGEMFVVRNVANLVPPFETGGGRLARRVDDVDDVVDDAVVHVEIRDSAARLEDGLRRGDVPDVDRVTARHAAHDLVAQGGVTLDFSQ